MYKDELVTETVLPSTPWRFFGYILLKHKVWAIGAMLMVTLAAVLSAGSSYFFKLIIDAVEAGDAEAAMRYGLMFPLVVIKKFLIH